MKAAQDGRYWLNPASEQAVDLICGGIKELKRYGLSGIQFDDYFYSGVSPKAFGYGKKQAEQALTDMIAQVHAVTKSAGLRFGISPQGVLSAELVPASDVKLYTALQSWCRSGIIDYIMPQVYYGFAHQTAGFEIMVSRWSSLVHGTDCKLMLGLAFYKCGQEDPFAGNGRQEWQKCEDMMARQTAFGADYACGFALFRYANVVDSQNQKEAQAVRKAMHPDSVE